MATSEQILIVLGIGLLNLALNIMAVWLIIFYNYGKTKEKHDLEKKYDKKFQIILDHIDSVSNMKESSNYNKENG